MFQSSHLTSHANLSHNAFVLYANSCGTLSSFYSIGVLDIWTCVPRKMWIPRMFPESQSDYYSLPPICQLFPSHSSPKSKECKYIKNRGRYSDEAEDPASICPLVFSLGLPRWPSDKETAYSAGDVGKTGLIPGSGRSTGEGNGNPFQYSCLENPMDRGAWQATVHGVAKSQTRLSTHTHMLVFSPFSSLTGHARCKMREPEVLHYVQWDAFQLQNTILENIIYFILEHN